MRKYKFLLIFSLALFILLAIKPIDAQATTVRKVKIGKTISVAKENATYTTSSRSIAFVSKDGRVFGKKTGEVTISVKTKVDGVSHTDKVKVKVIANDKKDYMTVCASEVTVTLADYEFGEYVPSKHYIPYSGKVIITNNGKKKITNASFKGTVGTRNVIVKTGELEPGESYTHEFSGVKAVRVSVPSTNTKAYNEAIKAEIEKVKKTKFHKIFRRVFSHGMVQEYDYVAKRFSYDYATKDEVAPVITGFVGKDSYSYDTYSESYELVPLMVVYSDKHDEYDFFKYVKAEDDRDVNCKLTVNTSKVDFTKTGVYTVTYKATDAAGNYTKATAKIGVRVPTSLDRLCDDILADIIKPGMSEQKKARAIYEFVRNDNFAYTGTHKTTKWETEAKNAIYSGAGDCFSFYAINRAMLTRCGIPNIPVNRPKSRGRHWWNMVYLNGKGFYHLDSTPRGRYYFGLVTDAQLTEYNRLSANEGVGGHYYSDKPKTATKELYSLFTKRAK